MPISPDRSSINYGPGKGVWKTLDLHSEGDITANIKQEFFDHKTAGFGVVKRVRKNLEIEVQMTPKMFDATIAATLLPYASTQIGASIYGATDSPLEIIPRTGAGKGLIAVNAALTKLPSLKLAAAASILGAATWAGIIGNALDPSALASYFTTPTNAAALTGFDKTKIPGGLYQATYGSISTPFYAEEGFMIDFALQLKDQTVQDLVYDKTLESLTATCKCAPVGPAYDALIALVGAVAHGAEPPLADLVITGPINFTLKNCQIGQAQGRYGSTVKRVGELEFTAVRTVTTGLLDPLWTIA